MLVRARSLELRPAGAPNFNVVGRKNLCWLVVDALLYNIVGREKQHVRGWEDVADVVHCWHFTSDPPAPPIFQCCLQVVTANLLSHVRETANLLRHVRETANLLSHVRETTLTFGGAGMGLQLCNFCPVSASLTNRRVAPSAESNPQQGLDLGSFFQAENGAAREGPPRCVRMKNGSSKFGCSIVFAECTVQGPRRRRAFWEKVCNEFRKNQQAWYI